MSILADFFIADGALAAALEDTSKIDPSDKLQARRLTPLEVGYLYQVALGRRPEYDGKLGFETIKVLNDGEQITTKLPDGFRDILASADGSQTKNWAHGWSQSELGWPESDCSDVATAIQQLAKRAKTAGKSLYLWNSV
jgi:hypothetical protein